MAKRQFRFKSLNLREFAMSGWRARKILGKRGAGKAQRSPATLRYPPVPEGGWPGGDPHQNGYAPKGGK